ncbi:EcsC family protein [Ectobacillus antri]|uniref:EcsC family protein n=1 Tax=Ectobacillus antri TaxID=2486280 RepID=A0ABT6H3M4_9BACI|nr:EcsC family protein [Ectobacillus antri]MDG4656512.1 EcsC family protein [Ectobacillus antri]MDG5753562.1 EcsC family protein [Ectobacillus antri]
MNLSQREQKIWNDIESWQYQLSQQDSTDFQRTYDKWLNSSFAKLPGSKKTEFFAKADQWLFHLHALIQSSQSQLDARNRILSNARLFKEEIEHIEDLRQLTIDQLIYITEQQVARHRLYSFVQGAATGAGGMLLLAADLPLMIAINLKAVQLIATTYGYDVNKPYEMMLALKVFHAAILPSRLQQYAWRELLEELEQDEYGLFFYEGAEDIIDSGTVQVVLTQILKVFAVHALRRKVMQGIPIMGIAVGSTVNYRMTRNVTEFTHRFYQMRYMLEKQSQ